MHVLSISLFCKLFVGFTCYDATFVYLVVVASVEVFDSIGPRESLVVVVFKQGYISFGN